MTQAIRLNPKAIISIYNRNLAARWKRGDDLAVPLQVRPKVTVILPNDAASKTAIRFAERPTPDLIALKRCRDQASTQELFLSCMNDEAMPAAYRLTRGCLASNRVDAIGVALCSSGRTDLLNKYGSFRQIKACVDQRGKETAAVAMCAGQQFLGVNERYYLECVTRNPESYASMTVCALSKDLTPEQQIALTCVVEFRRSCLRLCRLRRRPIDC